MIRKICLALSVFALAGCVTPEAEYSYGAPTTYRPAPYQGPTIYDTAERAPLHSELFACGSWGSNLGLVGARGEAAQFTPYIDTPAGPLLRNPTEQACLSSGFGWRGNAVSGRAHNGLDLANAQGGFIYAAGDGRITFADYRGGYGNVIEIEHGNGVRTLYAHMSEFDSRLRPGVRVREGQPIGRMGMTGNATGVHLHYEVYVDGMIVDPLHFGRPPVYVSAPVELPLPDNAQAADGH